MTPDSVPADADMPIEGVRVRAFLPLDSRRWSFSAILAVLLHLFVVVLLVNVGVHAAKQRGSSLLAFMAQAAGGGGGGGGGTGGAEFVAIAKPPPPPESPPVEEALVPPIEVPKELPEIEKVVEKEIPPAPAPVVPELTPTGGGLAGTGGGSGGGEGSGEGPGAGSGVGPGSGGGSGGGTGGGGSEGSPPVLKTLIIPPTDNVPKKLRGKTIEVTFWVNVTGRITDIDVVPEITDRKYARKFDEIMRGYRFTPARDGDGRIVPGVLTAQVTLPED